MNKEEAIEYIKSNPEKYFEKAGKTATIQENNVEPTDNDNKKGRRRKLSNTIKERMRKFIGNKQS